MAASSQSQGGGGNTGAPPPRARSWVFTVNNYNDQDEDRIKNIKCKYLIYGKEVGEQGTPHLQGTIQYPTQRVFKSVKKDLGDKAHIEICRDLYKSIEYCRKDGDVIEIGQPPSDGGAEGKEYWARILKQAREHGVVDDEQIQFKYRNVIQQHHRDYKLSQVLEDVELNNVWLYGPAGSGKSRWARETYPGLFDKSINKWWDGYDGEETVLLDDFDRSHSMLLHYVKRWADRYPFPAEVKGGCVRIRPKRIIVTSNWHPSEIWLSQSDLEPIMRRFKVQKLEGAAAATTFLAEGSIGI